MTSDGGEHFPTIHVFISPPPSRRSMRGETGLKANDCPGLGIVAAGLTNKRIGSDHVPSRNQSEFVLVMTILDTEIADTAGSWPAATGARLVIDFNNLYQQKYQVLVIHTTQLSQVSCFISRLTVCRVV